MLTQHSLVPRQQSIQVRQKKAGGVPDFFQVATLACLHHLGHVTAKDVKGIALYQDAGELSAGHANHGVVAAICEQLVGLDALHRPIQPDITS